MKRRLALLVSILFVLTALGSVAGASMPMNVAPGYENILRMATSPDPDTNDPQKTTEYFCVNYMIFDRLIEAVTTGPSQTELVPGLASSWEVTDDALTYTFHLQEGVKFHNGEDFTAEDVKYTMERMLWPETGAKNQSIFDSVVGAPVVMDGTTKELEGVKIIDDYTIEVTLSIPFGPFLANLAQPGAGILHKESTEAAGADFGLVPEVTFGTGAYYFDKWVINDELLVRRNDNYWRGPAPLDGISWRIPGDADTLRMMFEAGELDVFDTAFAPSQIPYFMESEQYKDNVVSGPRVGIYYFSFNQSIEPFNDVRVRKALQMAVDREAVLDVAFDGLGSPQYGILPPGATGYNPDLPEIPYDPEAAKALLAEAGYPDGFSMSIAHDSDSPSALTRIEYVAEMFREIGIDCTIDVMDSASWFAVRADGALPMYTSSWSADFNDPDNFIYTFFSSGTTNPRSFNFSNAELSKRVEDARAITDYDARIAEYQALEKAIIQDEAAWIPLFSTEHIFVVHDRLQGFKVPWNGWSDGWYYDQELTIVNP